MKHLFRLAALVVTLVLTGCASRTEQTLVILSTNDMHGKIQRFAELATAVRECRDTTDMVLLVDAGDRWTGNAYVDLVAEHGRPIIELMNHVGYDAATVGNHEFDFGQAHLGAILDSVAAFPVLCANVQSDTATFPAPRRSIILERGGLKIGLVGVVTNYENRGFPAGKMSSFEGLRFSDPQEAAIAEAEALRGEVDLLVLLSHMGDDRDRELISRCDRYDLVVSGHTHELLDTVVCGTQLGQTYKDLRNVGVTRIRMQGKRVAEISYENIPIGNFEADPEVAAMVAEYYADEELNRPIGSFARTASQLALANWFVELAKRDTKAEVGFYHIGGVRLDSIAAGSVGTAMVFDLEPFSARMATTEMTPAQMRQMIVTKYNEPTREGHRYDLVSTTPYRIITNSADEAVDVEFPTLSEGRSYRVTISDYAFKNYLAIDQSKGTIGGRRLTEMMIDALGRGPIVPDTVQHGSVVVR